MPKTDDNYFSYIYGSELARMDSETQAAVYRSIKSFSPNGQGEVALSVRDIQSRTLLSYGSVQATILELIKKGILGIVKSSGRRGGKVGVYKLINPRSLRIKSDQQLTESDQSTSTNLSQEKREKIKDNNFSSPAKMTNSVDTVHRWSANQARQIFSQIGGLQ